MKIQVKENISLAPSTIYKIGGPARFYVEAHGEIELKDALSFALEKRMPFFILGAGSNLLVSDKGYEGVVIHRIGGNAAVEGERLRAEADVMMASAVAKTMSAGLSGLEWAMGIPGTIGGSIRGNAGCFGGEIKDVVESVRVLILPKFEIRNFSKEECEFSYRDSVFKRHSDWIILSATLSLRKGNVLEIQEKVRVISRERAEKQDIGAKSCGCIFKNISWKEAGDDKVKFMARFPELGKFSGHTDIPASFLLDRAGLKGRRVGHIYVSRAHANFFVNEGGGTAEEVKKLIEIVKNEVKKKFGIRIEEEIQYLGF